MAEFTSHQPGTFTWPELATTDQNAGVAFYRALFGWDLNEQSMGPDGTYSMFLLRGKEVAAACSLRPDERLAGIPAHWNMYVTVESADEAAAKAKQLGGKVLAPAFDVMNVGRMAVLQDPSGAVFEVWEPKLHIGAKILNEPGALCWSELTTRDAKAAEAFYTKLFGWTAKNSSADAGGMQYTEFSSKGQPGVGMLPMPAQIPAGVPSVLDAVLPGHRHRRLGGESHQPRRQGDGSTAGHLEDRALRGTQRPAGCDVRGVHLRGVTLRSWRVPTGGVSGRPVRRPRPPSCR